MLTQMVKKFSPSTMLKPIFIGGFLAFTFYSQNLVKNLAVNYSDKTQIKINLPSFNFDESGNNLVIINPKQNNNDDAVEKAIQHEIALVQANLNKVEKKVIRKKSIKKIAYKTIINRTPVEVVVANAYEINNSEIFKEAKVTTQIVDSDYKVTWAKNFQKMSSQIFANLNKIEPEVEKIENTVSFEPKPIQNVTNVTEDKVEQVASSVSKEEVKEEVAANEELDNELTLFDYSKAVAPKVNAAPKILSSTVMSVIHREKENINSLTTQRPKVAFNYRAPQNTNESLKETATTAANLMGSETNDYSTNNFSLSLKAFELNFEDGESGYLTNFNFRPNYLEADVVADNYEGVIKLEGKLNNEYSVLSGTITKNEYMPIKVDLVLEKQDTEYNVPLIPEASFNNYVDNNKLSGKGGNVLIRINEEIKSVDFDKKYEKRLFLDKKFAEVADVNGAEYILFLGINSGNALMELTAINGKILSKVINIEEEKINFDIISLESINQSTISLRENRLFSEKEKDLIIDEDKVTLFNTNIKGKSTGALNNRYEFLDYLKFYGEREYFEFGHLNETIFVGKNRDTEVLELPNEEYVNQIYKSLNLSDLDNQCLTQINLSKKIKNSQMELISQNGPAPLNISYYDNDGTFNNDITDYTSKIYMAGDTQGAINLKLEYVDGTVDYLRTYCSIGSYVIEQN